MKKPAKPFFAVWVSCTWRSLLIVCSREFKVEVNQGAPQVAYKEAFNITIEHRETLKKQTGGRGKFADIQFSLGPVDAEWKAENPDKHYQFVNDLFGGSIPKRVCSCYSERI